VRDVVAHVVAAIAKGLSSGLTLEEACRRLRLSPERVLTAASTRPETALRMYSAIARVIADMNDGFIAMTDDGKYFKAVEAGPRYNKHVIKRYSKYLEMLGVEECFRVGDCVVIRNEGPGRPLRCEKYATCSLYDVCLDKVALTFPHWNGWTSVPSDLVDMETLDKHTLEERRETP
jgi:hypothetical protein